jgi:hypothetical protein
MGTYYFNKEVIVDAVYFRKADRLKSYPKHMVVDDRDVTFTESGLQYLIKKGTSVFHLFDMTDGRTNYRLKLDPNRQVWTLVRAVPAGN